MSNANVIPSATAENEAVGNANKAAAQKKMNLPQYLLTKGKRAETKPQLMMRPTGLKTRDTNVSLSPPNEGHTANAEAVMITHNTPGNVKRKEVLKCKWFNSPTDVLSPCSQKLWRKGPANVGLEVPSSLGNRHGVEKMDLNLASLSEEDNDEELTAKANDDQMDCN